MRRIGLLTAGGDTPALNATIYGAVERASAREIEVLGFIGGFDGVLHPETPHVHLNPLFITIPELDPTKGGTILGASRTYVDPEHSEIVKGVAQRLERLNIEGLLCIGGDGTISGMQPIADFVPCVLAPKTIDNDLGLNYLDEPNDWIREPADAAGKCKYRRQSSRDEIALEEIVNYATPGYATAVFVVAQGVERSRTTAESHRRIAIIEVMGRYSGYIALGSAYGQPDIIVIPEVPLDHARLEARVRELFCMQQNVVIVVGEGAVDEEGHLLGNLAKRFDPAGNTMLSGAAEHLKRYLDERLGEEFFRPHRGSEGASSAIFTRKVGHTQRGGRPIKFDRFYATQLGGKAVDLLAHNGNNAVATLQWTEKEGFVLDSLPAAKLCDRWNLIHARQVHPSLYDAKRFQPSRLGIEYLKTIFTSAIGTDDMEFLRTEQFSPGKLSSRYQSVNIDIEKRVTRLPQGNGAAG